MIARALIVALTLIALGALSLHAAAAHQPVTLRLTAYIPERTTFTADESGFIVSSNANNFTYSVHEQAMTRILTVVAH